MRFGQSQYIDAVLFFAETERVLKEFKEIKNGAKLTVEVTVELKDNKKPA